MKQEFSDYYEVDENGKLISDPCGFPLFMTPKYILEKLFQEEEDEFKKTILKSLEE